MRFTPPPGPLHHYFSLANGPEKIRWLKELVVDGKAFLRSPLDFNDPFDCLPLIAMPKTPVAWDLLGRRYREAVRADFGSKMAEDMWASYCKLSSTKKVELLLDASRATSAAAGIFCLTELDDSVLMWSHYADNHKGVCISFDLEGSKPSDLWGAQPVQYAEARPEIPALRKTGETSEMYHALLRKADFWSYEKEWRVVVAGRAGEHLSFPPSTITTVTFGARCTAEMEQRVRDELSGRQTPIVFRKASISDSQFKILIDPA